MTKNSPTVSKIKAASAAKNRYSRAKVRALKRRRDDLINGLGRAISRDQLTADLVTDAEGFMLAAGHLVGAKAIARRVARRALLCSSVPHSLPPITTGTEIPRPSRIVGEERPPSVLPGLVAEEPVLGLLSVEAAIQAALTDMAASKTTFRILDAFKAATDMSWGSAASMLANAGVFRGQLSAVSISMTARARRFWELWEGARDAYRAAVHLRQIQPANGEWGLIENDHVRELLSEFSVPKSALRNEWLVRLIRKPPTSLLDLDFHASTYTPLFTVSM